MVRPLIGAPLHSDGKLTIVSIAAEAGLRRNKLTHKPHRPQGPVLRPGQGPRPHLETVPESARARADKQQQDLTRIRAEHDDLRSQAQLLAWIVQVLEIENHQLKEADTNLRGQVAAQGQSAT